MSARDTFVPPSSVQGLAVAASGAAMYKPTAARYICANCGSLVSLAKGEPVRCKECGHRVLYKERTRRIIQFEAR